MKRTYLKLSPLFMGLWIASCSPAYVPNKVNTGLFTEEGEMHAEVSTGISGIDVQAAAAIPGNLVVTANASFKNKDFSNTIWQDDENNTELLTIEGNKTHRIFEVGAGYYHVSKGGFTVEAIVSYGHGNLDNVETDIFGPVDENSRISATTFVTESTFNKIYIQPTLGLSRKVVDFGFTPKVALVRVTVNDQQFRNTFFEPVVTLRLGPEYFKFTGQAGLSIPAGEEISFSYEPFIFSVGIMADINVLNLIKNGGE